MWAAIFMLVLLVANTSAQYNSDDVYALNTQGNIFPWISRFYPEEKRSSSAKMKSLKERFRGTGVKETFFG
ncbi:unnamed protein product [Auanema sp. JU1783]|nr:unnamed protein product [Auanema sp. JU1783]